MIGRVCRKSPPKIIHLPPNGNLLFIIFLSFQSIYSNWDLEIHDASSIINTLVNFNLRFDDLLRSN